MSDEEQDLFATTDNPDGALTVLRRGIKRSPELKSGLAITVAMGLSVAAGRLAIPVLIQRGLDEGVLSGDGVNMGVIWRLSAIALVVLVASAIMSWQTQRRLLERAEKVVAGLRVDAFDHIGKLSIAYHNESRRGTLVARVTSDCEALARFTNWGLYSWTIQPAMIVGTLLVLAWYSWVLALIALVCYLPAFPLLKAIQRRQLAAYDVLRTRISEMLSSFSEAVTGVHVVKAYGAEDRILGDLNTSIEDRYDSRIHVNKYMASTFVVGDTLGALAFIGILVVGLVFRDSLGLGAGELVAALFLTELMKGPIAELTETLDQTLTAISGWRKVLNLMDQPIDIPEADPGLTIPGGAVHLVADHIDFAYNPGELVLHDVSLDIPAGTNVAIVGETGSGKTTFAKLLCRLADPTSGRFVLNGVELAEAGTESRLDSVRMVPQDGFLFDTSIGENIRYGRSDATDAEIVDAFELLGLAWWLEKLPSGLATEVGERGGSLSVGERQLIALVRASLADPGLLVLDEATSAVDPETDQALTKALQRLAVGRTMVSIAHRLATAEAADLVVVFDQGRVVEVGAHSELVGAGGIYGRLHAAWVGNTQSR